MQTDPIGYGGGMNMYAYVGNDPVNHTDPTGTQTVQDMQLEMQIEDMRQQGMSERQIQAEIGSQGRLQATALLTAASLVIAPEILLARGGAFIAGRIASSSFVRAFSVAERIAGGLERTGGSSGQRTWQGFLSGGRAAAQRLFNGITRGQSVARDGVRLGRLGDGSTVQMSTRALRDGTIRTDLRISRQVAPTSSHIPRREIIKLRFDEAPQ